jgi:hypothetical protein
MIGMSDSAAAVPLSQVLRFGVYEFTLQAETDAWLPRYKGSTLRGAFGTALKQAVCIRRDLDCDICLVRPSCVYTHVFETLPPEGVAAFRGQKYAPHPYVLEPPLEEKQKYEPGERLTFGLTLMGRAIDYLPYVIFALDQAGRKGLGQRRGRFVLASVSWRGADGEEQVIYDGAERRLTSGWFSLSAEDIINRRLRQLDISNLQSSHLRLVFLTPARLQVQGDLQGGVSFELLVRNVLRRLWQLTLVHGSGEFALDHRALIERAESVKVVGSDLRWLDWERYSSRQKTRMRLGGFVGEVEYEFAVVADLEVFLPLLMLGEVVHVGKNTTFGLGKYEIATRL